MVGEPETTCPYPMKLTPKDFFKQFLHVSIQPWQQDILDAVERGEKLIIESRRRGKMFKARPIEFEKTDLYLEMYSVLVLCEAYIKEAEQPESFLKQGALKMIKKALRRENEE